MRHDSRLRFVPYFASVAAVAIVGAAAYLLNTLVPLPHVSVLFIAAVVTSAALYGFWPSVFASILSVGVSSYFFYSPIFSFRVADVQDIADLAVFVIVAALTSRLAANVRAQALQARLRQAALARVLAFSDGIAASTTDEQVHETILEHLAPILGRPIHLLVPQGGRLTVAASLGAKSEELTAEARAACERALGSTSEAGADWRLEVLRTAHAAVGIVVAPRQPAPHSDPEDAKPLLGQAALAIERARLRREIGEARLKMQGEALRDALINSVSHDLQTPLAAILGSATALESFGEQGAPRARQELVATIREETERLGSYIANVLDLSRIRAGQISARLELVELSDIVNAALRRKQKALRAHEIRVAVPADLPMLRLDLFLMEHALANVLDNCAKYAPEGSAVEIAAHMQDGDVMLDVTDAGCGIREQDLERVFEPFYRGLGPHGRPAPGSGLGLSICRTFVEANGGSVSVSVPPGGRGAMVRMRLPVPENAGVPENTLADE